MREEIFGPILPVIKYQNTEALLSELQKPPHPLAIYIFTKNRSIQNKFISTLPSGSAAINETIKQASTNYLPFGGVGDSGMGTYHGKASFDSFSIYKSVMQTGYFGTRFHFPPYRNGIKALKKFYHLFY